MAYTTVPLFVKGIPFYMGEAATQQWFEYNFWDNVIYTRIFLRKKVVEGEEDFKFHSGSGVIIFGSHVGQQRCLQAASQHSIVIDPSVVTDVLVMTKKEKVRQFVDEATLELAAWFSQDALAIQALHQERAEREQEIVDNHIRYLWFKQQQQQGLEELDNQQPTTEEIPEQGAEYFHTFDNGSKGNVSSTTPEEMERASFSPCYGDHDQLPYLSTSGDGSKDFFGTEEYGTEDLNGMEESGKDTFTEEDVLFQAGRDLQIAIQKDDGEVKQVAVPKLPALIVTKDLNTDIQTEQQKLPLTEIRTRREEVFLREIKTRMLRPTTDVATQTTDSPPLRPTLLYFSDLPHYFGPGDLKELVEDKFGRNCVVFSRVFWQRIREFSPDGKEFTKDYTVTQGCGVVKIELFKATKIYKPDTVDFTIENWGPVMVNRLPKNSQLYAAVLRAYRKEEELTGRLTLSQQRQMEEDRIAFLATQKKQIEHNQNQFDGNRYSFRLLQYDDNFIIDDQCSWVEKYVQRLYL